VWLAAGAFNGVGGKILSDFRPKNHSVLILNQHAVVK
jgi:hypothetical protein